MRNSMSAMTYGKLYDLRAMQPQRPDNRRRLNPLRTDANLIVDLRKLADDIDRSGVLVSSMPRAPK